MGLKHTKPCRVYCNIVSSSPRTAAKLLYEYNLHLYSAVIMYVAMTAATAGLEHRQY